MRTRTTAAAITGALFLLTLVGCSSNTEPDKPPTATSSTPVNHEAAAQACTDALFEIDSAAREAGTDPDDRVKPKACGTLTTDEYLDAVLAVTQQLNQNARDDLQDQIDKAAETDQ